MRPPLDGHLKSGFFAPAALDRPETTSLGAVYYNTLPPVESVFPWVAGKVPHPYGEWYNEALEGSGGWTRRNRR